MEGTATFGLLLICAALVAPFAGASTVDAMGVFEWVYASGALIYCIARLFAMGDPEDSLRIKRLRRMEFWGGMCFAVGSGSWFYSSVHLGENAGVLALLKDTVMFTLAGAVVQIISSWLIVSQTKKEKGGH